MQHVKTIKNNKQKSKHKSLLKILPADRAATNIFVDKEKMKENKPKLIQDLCGEKLRVEPNSKTIKN
jgi:hypothetical protein